MEFSEQDFNGLIDLTGIFLDKVTKMYANNEIDFESFITFSAPKIAFLRERKHGDGSFASFEGSKRTVPMLP